ncbi:retinol dehydrogenase 12 [Rostrohypoxylon terebratum]|nr:retinol dehydrogenase 12 [Rostrohypoxylon terebratum]
MTALGFTDAEIQSHARLSSFLCRQLFERPSLPQKDLTGKTIIVTGSNSGVGFECARQLLDLGVSNLILAVRNEAKGKAARTKLLSGWSAPNSTVEIWQLDLESYESIFAFVKRARSLERLDIVVLNAGSKSSTDNPSRLAIVSSDLPNWAKFRERNSAPLLPALDKEDNFSQWDRYPTSKLLAQLFVAELAKRISPSIAIITMPNPGLCYDTGLGHIPGGTWRETLSRLPKRTLGRSASIGARVVTDGAIEHESHGQYIGDCKILPKAPLVYTSEGERLSKILWDEIMAELSFADVEDILRGLEDPKL